MLSLKFIGDRCRTGCGSGSVEARNCGTNNRLWKNMAWKRVLVLSKAVQLERIGFLWLRGAALEGKLLQLRGMAMEWKSVRLRDMVMEWKLVRLRGAALEWCS